MACCTAGRVDRNRTPGVWRRTRFHQGSSLRRWRTDWPLRVVVDLVRELHAAAGGPVPELAGLLMRDQQLPESLAPTTRVWRSRPQVHRVTDAEESGAKTW